MKRIGWILLTSIILLNVGIAKAYKVEGNGTIKSEVRILEPFNRIEINGAFNVYLSQNNKTGLRVVADENLLEIIGSKVVNGRLIVKIKENIKSYTKMELYISFKELINLEANGAIRLKAKKQLKFDNFRLEINGASAADLNISANKIIINNAGASSTTLRGSSKYLDIDISGAGSANTIDLKANYVTIELSGVGKGNVYATDKLNVSISGIGSVKYKGDPSITSNISLLGSLKRY